MKRTLEAALVLAALALGAYVVRQSLSRRALAAHPPVFDPASAPGADVEDPDAAPSTSARGVTGLPMIKLSRPAKPSRHAASVPPPVSAAP